jgi:hypothetical protein
MNDSPTISLRTARWIILIGICLTSLGISVAARLEWQSGLTGTRAISSNIVPDFLESRFVLITALGLSVTLFGSVIWAWRTTIRRLVWSGIEVVVLAPLVYASAPINVHSDLALLMIVVPVAVLIGVLFFIIAAIRAYSPRQAGKGPG